MRAQESRPGEKTEAANKSFDGDNPSLSDPTAIIDNFSRRVIQDALQSQLSIYWLKRAEGSEAARPRSGDYRGAASTADLAERDVRLARQARNCRHHATIVEFEDVEDLLASVLGEAPGEGRRAA